MSEDSTEVIALPAPAEDETGLERLQRRPIIDRIDQRTLALIKATLAISENDQQPITDAEVGHFLELCAAYGLDPFAREAWIAKSKTGKLLIMVGRAGLRKVVTRNGMKMSSAVVHAKDTFRVAYIDNPEDAKPGEWEAWGSAPFHRITHEYSGLGVDDKGRGPIIGAWARVRDLKSRQERGYFDAPLSEYMPSNVSQYSPWSKQTSAMTRGAVERQAASEATPLGGVLVDGEQYTVESTAVEIGTGDGDGTEPGWDGLLDEQVVEIEALIEVAAAFGAPLDRASVQMRLNGRPEAVGAWLDETKAALADRKPAEVAEGQETLDVEGGES